MRRKRTLLPERIRKKQKGFYKVQFIRIFRQLIILVRKGKGKRQRLKPQEKRLERLPIKLDITAVHF